MGQKRSKVLRKRPFAPLYYLAKKLISEGKTVSVVLGFNTEDEIFYRKKFEKLGCRVTVATADGSYGVKGFVTDALPDDYSYFYCCGPMPMLKAVYGKIKFYKLNIVKSS